MALVKKPFKKKSVQIREKTNSRIQLKAHSASSVGSRSFEGLKRRITSCWSQGGHSSTQSSHSVYDENVKFVTKSRLKEKRTRSKKNSKNELSGHSINSGPLYILYTAKHSLNNKQSHTIFNKENWTGKCLLVSPCVCAHGSVISDTNHGFQTPLLWTLDSSAFTLSQHWFCNYLKHRGISKNCSILITSSIQCKGTTF